MNLAVNARDAMPKGGRLTIATAAAGPCAAPPGPHALLAVTDTGCGMDEQVRAHLFEPFFTTKEPGKGTGLGLATVYGIIQQSGGHIEVFSEPGRYTTFNLYFPLAPEPAPPTAAEPRSRPAPAARGTETVLLVEDEAGVRDLARRTLAAHGYRVLEACDGLDAVSRYGHHPGPIHLVLTDVVMPRLSGPAMVKRLAAGHPRLKVVYMSGYTDSALVRHGVVATENNYLLKPFTAEDLTRMVREALDQAGEQQPLFSGGPENAPLSPKGRGEQEAPPLAAPR
jgi:CheY-like chemotaxis protein